MCFDTIVGAATTPALVLALCHCFKMIRPHAAPMHALRATLTGLILAMAEMIPFQSRWCFAYKIMMCLRRFVTVTEEAIAITDGARPEPACLGLTYMSPEKSVKRAVAISICAGPTLARGFRMRVGTLKKHLETRITQ